MKQFFKGSTMSLALIASGYAFSKLEIKEQKAAKLAAYFTAHAFWGSTICYFILKFLPQVRLSLILPLSISSFAAYAFAVKMSYRPGIRGE